ncbi:hypothetical protein [Rhodobacter sp. SY28-1]|nr:hypothetical protein [Rhodobacter sp. SY28-1]
MSHRFPPLRPPVETGRKANLRADPTPGPTAADLCLLAALVLSLALAMI